MWTLVTKQSPLSIVISTMAVCPNAIHYSVFMLYCEPVSLNALQLLDCLNALQSVTLVSITINISRCTLKSLKSQCTIVIIQPIAHYSQLKWNFVISQSQCTIQSLVSFKAKNKKSVSLWAIKSVNALLSIDISKSHCTMDSGHWPVSNLNVLKSASLHYSQPQ